MHLTHLEHKSIVYRKQILEIIMCAKAGHIGGSLSCIDILNVLYNHVMNVSPQNFFSRNHDRYIQSKGHAVHALYTVLADKGFFPYHDLTQKDRFGTLFIGHPTRDISGIEINTGALGHGLSVGAGMALTAKRDNLPVRVFVTMGDGELAEGSVWEAAMFAGHYHLDNLTIIIDRNKLQISGPTEDVMSLEPLDDKFKSFGCSVRSVDGNHIPSLLEIFARLPFEFNKPSLIIANTVKGKGISFMENQAIWHHRVPTNEEYLIALEELENTESEYLKKHHESFS